MAIERITVQELIEMLHQFPGDLPVVVRSYEAGYDPLTDVELLTIAPMENRMWYVGIYDKTDGPGEKAVLISSRYTQAELDAELDDEVK